MVCAGCVAIFLASGTVCYMARISGMIHFFSVLAMTVSLMLAIGFLVSALLGRISSAVLVVFLVASFGFSTGYLDAWVDKRTSEDFRGQWYDPFAGAGDPGILITMCLVPKAPFWYPGDLWTFRYHVAGSNAIFWTTLGIILGVPIHIVSRFKHKRGA